MRRILVDYARGHRAEKRDAKNAWLDWERIIAQAPEPPGFLLDLDRALQRLARLSPRQSRVVELRFFAGLTIQETADVLHLGVTVIKQDWALARSWLQRELRKTL
jgi:RNA polymerase sigma-70 factor, ECF subfamily